MKNNNLLKMVGSLTTLGILLLSCAVAPPTKEQIDNANFGSYPSDYKTKVMDCMGKNLFDPYSAIYRISEPYKGYAYMRGTYEFGYLVYAGVNAKNRMGGYVGEKAHTFFFPTDVNGNCFLLNPLIKRGELEDKPVDEPLKETSKNNNSTQKVNESIIQLKGSGIKNTRPFTVNGPWEIQWDAKGDYFSVIVYTADGSLVGFAGSQEGPGKNSSYQPKGGRYYINVSAMGNWEVKVVEVK